MKNRAYKWLTLLMTASMLASGLPVHAAGADEVPVAEAVIEEEEDAAEVQEADGETMGEWQVNVNEGLKEVEITGYNGGGGALNIPDRLGDYMVTGIAAYAFRGMNNITSVNIPNSIQKIGAQAFQGCDELQTVTFDEGSTGIQLSAEIFQNCDKLTRITLSGRVSDIPSSFAFGCKQLETVVWPANLNSIGSQAFDSCERLKSSDLSGTALTTIGSQAFDDCTGLPMVKFPTGQALTIGSYAFRNAGLLAESGASVLTIPANVSSIGQQAFLGCDEIQEVVFASGGTAITLDAETFNSCDKVKKITLSNRVTSLPHSFAFNCPTLEEVVWTASLTSIGNQAFDSDARLRSSDLSGTALTSIGNQAFDDCTGLPMIKLPTGQGLTIGSYAFRNADLAAANGTSVLTIPANVSSIGQQAFQGCDEMQEVVFEGGNSSLTLNNELFQSCDKLRKITLSNRISAIPGSFAGNCKQLEEVVWPSTLQTIGDSAFDGDVRLRSSDLSATALTGIGNQAFDGCTVLPVVKLPSSKPLSIGSYAFRGAAMGPSAGEESSCLVIPATVTSIGSQAFQNSDDLQEVVFAEGSSVITLQTEIFNACDDLQKITLSNRVETIPANFASNCPKLVQLVDATDVIKIPNKGAFTTSKLSEIVLTNCNNTVYSYSWAEDQRVVVEVAVSVVLEQGEYTVEAGKSLDLQPQYLAVPENAAVPLLNWKSENESIAKVSDQGVVKGVKEGSTWVTVSSPQGIEKATVKINVTRKGSAPAKEPEPFIMVAGGNGATDPQPLVMESTTDLVLIKGQKFVLGNKDWKVNAEGKKFVSASKGNIKVKKGGTGAVLSRATQGGGTQSISITVLAPVITKAEKTLKLEAGQQGQLSFSGTTAKAGSISFTEDNLEVPIRFFTASPDVALVDDSGNVTAIAKGTATITAYIYGVAFKFKVKVTETSPAAKRFLHLNVGKSKNIKIKGLKKTVWNQVAGEEGVVDIIKGSKIKALDKTGTVILQCEGYQLYVVVEDPSIVGGDKPYSTTLTLTKGTASLVQLKSIADPSNVYFKSNKSHIAYCDENGYIHARGTGKAKLTAKVNGKTVTVNVIVKE